MLAAVNRDTAVSRETVWCVPGRQGPADVHRWVCEWYSPECLLAVEPAHQDVDPVTINDHTTLVSPKSPCGRLRDCSGREIWQRTRKKGDWVY